jgi:Domain of unknown function (DUF1735)
MMMKLNIKQSLLMAALLLAAVIVGCEKDDNHVAYGYTNIFMPQATSTGGTTVNYLVPAGKDSATYNYKVDAKNNKVNVMLGVERSGLQSNDAFSVSVISRTDTAAQVVAGGTLGNTAVVLPVDAYTIPATVDVPDGANQNTFYMSVDLTKLKTYTGKKLVACVALSNPTKYQLNSAISKTVVVIDVSALKLP